MINRLKSGEIAPKSGTYNVISSNGKIVGSVRMAQGDSLPPTSHEGSHFEFCSDCE